MSDKKVECSMRERVLELAAAGMKYKEISKITGVPVSTVGKIAVGVNQKYSVSINSMPRQLLDEWDTVTRKLRKYFKEARTA